MGDERHVGEFVADHGLFDKWFAVYDAFAGMSDCVFEADSWHAEGLTTLA